MAHCLPLLVDGLSLDDDEDVSVRQRFRFPYHMVAMSYLFKVDVRKRKGRGTCPSSVSWVLFVEGLESGKGRGGWRIENYKRMVVD